MNSKGLFRVTSEGFVPFDRRSRDLHSKLARRDDGKPVFLTVRTARNPEFSALAHVVFGKLAKGLGVPIEVIKAYIKEQIGLYDLVRLPNGTVIKMRHSVAFSAMGEEQFREFWKYAQPVIFEKLLGGVRSKEYDEIVAIIEGHDRNAAQ